MVGINLLFQDIFQKYIVEKSLMENQLLQKIQQFKKKVEFKNHKMNEIIIYTDDQENIQLEVRLEEDTVWLTQAQMAELFNTTSQNITIHLKNIYKEAEVDEKATCKESLQVQKEGSRMVRGRNKFYNLDAILSVGLLLKK